MLLAPLQGSSRSQRGASLETSNLFVCVTEATVSRVFPLPLPLLLVVGWLLTILIIMLCGVHQQGTPACIDCPREPQLSNIYMLPEYIQRGERSLNHHASQNQLAATKRQAIQKQ